MANESRPENNAPRETEGSAPISGSHQTSESVASEVRHRGNHETTEDNIVVSSPAHDERESPLSPAPSTVVSDPFDPSYSPRSPSPDDRNTPIDSEVPDEEFDLGDYNDPPRSLSPCSEGVNDPVSDECPHKTADNSAGAGGSPTAVESLRAIQAELIPGYEGPDARTEEATTSSARVNLPLFPGLLTQLMRGEHINP